MIEVRLRHVNQSEAVRLMDWDPTDLDGAMKLITTWGLRFEVDGTEYGLPNQFTGQLVVDGNRAYFEILVDDGNGE